LDDLEDLLPKFPSTEFYIHCAGGYRSVIAASLLKRHGIDKIIDVKGGYGAIKQTTLEKTAYICPSTL
jgi:hydroxyacylglutathione hydrolase